MYFILFFMIGLFIPCLIRVIIGPSVWDRLLGMSLISNKIIIIIIIYASINNTMFLLDFAIIYALSGFIGTIFIALFLSHRDLRKKVEEAGIRR